MLEAKVCKHCNSFEMKEVLLDKYSMSDIERFGYPIKQVFVDSCEECSNKQLTQNDIYDMLAQEQLNQIDEEINILNLLYPDHQHAKIVNEIMDLIDEFCWKDKMVNHEEEED